MLSLFPRHDSPAMTTIIDMLNAQFAEIAQMDRPAKERTQTARSYGSALRALSDYMEAKGVPLPTRALLDDWREDMLQGRLTTDKGKVFAVNSVNLRLGAARALLRAAAAQLANPQQRLLLREWAEVGDARAVFRQDVLDEEYGVHLSRMELETYISQIKTTTLKGLRDRALIMVLAGAGLRISETVRLTLADVFLTRHPCGLWGIRVRHGKHRRSRIVVIGEQNHPIFEALRAYVAAIHLPLPSPILPAEDESLADLETDWAIDSYTRPGDTSYEDIYIFRSLKRGPNRQTITSHRPLSPRSVERIVAGYPARHRKKRIRLMPHDLRRTFASLCKDAGMSWEALREQMGHSRLPLPNDENHFVDWAQRVPGWRFSWDQNGR